MFDRFFNNLKNISLILKTLSILHVALQEEEMSLIVAHTIKEKEHLLYPYQKDDQSYGKHPQFTHIFVKFCSLPIDTKMQSFIGELYLDYIKNLTNFIIISPLYYSKLGELHQNTKTLDVRQLFLVLSRIDGLMESVLKVFAQKTYCHNYRIFHNIIYSLFVDLLKIYQSYYVLVSVMLDKFEEMDLRDAKRAFIVYLNFIKINKEIRKMALSVLQEFNIKLDIYFFDIDTKVAEALKVTIETKERKLERSIGKKGSSSFAGSSTDLQATKEDQQTEGGNRMDIWLEIQSQPNSTKKTPHSPNFKANS